jgi:hypothetical protein
LMLFHPKQKLRLLPFRVRARLGLDQRKLRVRVNLCKTLEVLCISVSHLDCLGTENI